MYLNEWVYISATARVPFNNPMANKDERGQNLVFITSLSIYKNIPLDKLTNEKSFIVQWLVSVMFSLRSSCKENGLESFVSRMTSESNIPIDFNEFINGWLLSRIFIRELFLERCYSNGFMWKSLSFITFMFIIVKND